MTRQNWWKSTFLNAKCFDCGKATDKESKGGGDSKKQEENGGKDQDKKIQEERERERERGRERGRRTKDAKSM
jgi:hypothetical protein